MAAASLSLAVEYPLTVAGRLIDMQGISQRAHCNSTVFPYNVSDAHHVVFVP